MSETALQWSFAIAGYVASLGWWIFFTSGFLMTEKKSGRWSGKLRHIPALYIVRQLCWLVLYVVFGWLWGFVLIIFGLTGLFVWILDSSVEFRQGTEHD